MESTEIIGNRQYLKARELFEAATIQLKGPVDFRHSFVNMTHIPVNDPRGNRSTTCPPAMGASFAAGTTDGPGAFDFVQGNTTLNPFWNFVSGILSKPTAEDLACHWPKPILLNTGALHWPYDWHPSIVPVQVVRVGQLVIAAPPGEFTTMAGRRLKSTLKAVYGPDSVVVIMGLANTYSHYITTFEEYQAQRYEAASTLFGPHTLQAYLDIFEKMARSMVAGAPVDEGIPPPDFQKQLLELLPPVVLDSVPAAVKFGDVVQGKDVKTSYRIGETASVTFWTGCPRNDLFTQRSFLYVEKNVGGQWVVILDDGDWDTIMDWDRPAGAFSTESQATMTWKIGHTNIGVPVEAGSYRIRHSGAQKGLLGVTHFEGVSAVFTVTQ